MVPVFPEKPVPAQKIRKSGNNSGVSGVLAVVKPCLSGSKRGADVNLRGSVWTNVSRKGTAMSGAEDQQTTQRQRQCREVFEREVERLLDRLYGTALRLTRNPDDAEDVVAEAVSKAWSRIDQLADLHSMEHWLFRILNNTFISFWRRQRRRQSVETVAFVEDSDSEAETFSLFEKLHQPFLLWWGTPEQELLNQILQDDLRQALDALPDAFRIVIVLVEIQGYTYEEAARMLDVPMGTVRSRLNRGRSLLQKRLWEQARETGLTKAGDGARGRGQS